MNCDTLSIEIKYQTASLQDAPQSSSADCYAGSQ